MADNFYLMPLVGAGTESDSFRPKYADTFSAAGLYWEASAMGGEPAFLVYVRDVDAGTAATLAADADVTVIPPLANTIPSVTVRNNVRAKLEALNVPAGWVVVGMSYQTVIHYTFAIFQLQQRLAGAGLGRLFTGGVTLDTPWNQLSANVQQRFLDMADSFGLDKAGLSGTSTLRVILKSLADQLATPLVMAGVTI